MALRFNKLFRPELQIIQDHAFRAQADSALSAMTAIDKLVFMSHKTGDWSAENEARHIVSTHRVAVYLAEWDDNVQGDSNQLPDYIMNAIRRSNGFLVNVSATIGASMWIGYEIGGAHAMGKSRARRMHAFIAPLPSVVGALDPLHDRAALDRWIRQYVTPRS